MKLIASLVVRNEIGRYLIPVIGSLLEFCDEVRVLDDGSTDGTTEWLTGHFSCDKTPTLTVEQGFYEHEGRTRQRLFDWTLEGEPTHILAIDADEFISDGKELRRAIENQPEQPVWLIEMIEIWKATQTGLQVRCDGGWRSHPISCLYRAPTQRELIRDNWHMSDKALACGREPLAVRRMRGGIVLDVDILHFGWANENHRSTRYQRYVEHDDGAYHQKKHLLSIMWDDKQVSLHPCDWPNGLKHFKGDILRRVQDPGIST